MVSILSILCMGAAGVIAIAVPVALFIYYYKKKKADILPFFIGCAVMVFFAMVLEALIHRLVLGSSAGSTIQNNTWLYALYGGFMAALFEESGRLIAFKTVLKKYRYKDANALMYGAGHGGIEAALLLGITSVNNIVTSIMINTGTISAATAELSGDMLDQVNTAVRTLIETPAATFLLGGVERIFAIALHVALSVLVWTAVKKDRKGYWFLSFALHFLVDAVTVILAGYGIPAIAVEAAVGLMTLAAVVIAKAVWKKEGLTCAEGDPTAA